MWSFRRDGCVGRGSPIVTPDGKHVFFSSKGGTGHAASPEPGCAYGTLATAHGARGAECVCNLRCPAGMKRWGDGSACEGGGKKPCDLGGCHGHPNSGIVSCDECRPKNLVKVDTDTGKEAWAFPVGTGCSTTFFALSEDPGAKCVCATGGSTSLHKLDSATGTKIWAVDVGDRAAAPPVLSSDGSHLYLSMRSSGLAKVDTATGSTVWVFGASGSTYAESWMITPSLSTDGRSIYAYGTR